ncbi:MAG: hypothetical protein ACRDSK_31020, partial [Actinophytocola sp.]
LTAAGARSAARLLAARAAPLAEVLSDLDASQRATLAGLLEPVLARLYSRTGSSELVCRLCDRASCTTDAVCPVGEAARRAAQRDADRSTTGAAGGRGEEAGR